MSNHQSNNDLAIDTSLATERWLSQSHLSTKPQINGINNLLRIIASKSDNIEDRWKLTSHERVKTENPGLKRLGLPSYFWTFLSSHVALRLLIPNITNAFKKKRDSFLPSSIQGLIPSVIPIQWDFSRRRSDLRYAKNGDRIIITRSLINTPLPGIKITQANILNETR